MTYTRNLKELTAYLADFLMEEIGETTISSPLFEEIQQMMVETIKNGVEAFCEGASASGLRYEVAVIADDVNKPVVFEQWSVSDVREEMAHCGYSRDDLPTLHRLDDDQLYELLEHIAYKGWSITDGCDRGLMLTLLEEIAEDYFPDES